MYSIFTTRRFDRDVKLCKKRGLPTEKIYEVIKILRDKGSLPTKYQPHKLTGDYKGYWECHIQPDWLLVWEQRDKELVLIMTRTGSHSDIFK